MRRSLLLAFLIYALALGALASLNGHLLVLLIPLVLHIGAGLYFGTEQLQLRATRSLSRVRVSEGQTVSVKLVVTNDGARIDEVLIEEQPPAQLHVIKSDAAALTETRILVSLAPGDSVELNYTVRAKRGHHLFEDIHVTAIDHFDLFKRKASFCASGESELYVLPPVTRVRQIAIRPRQTRVFAGAIPARVGGSGTEFFGVRAYQPGDALRHINWKANARHPQALFTNEFQQERIADVGLILDARRRVDVRAGSGTLFEHSILVTAALAETFLDGGNRVGMVSYGGYLNWTLPGYGKYQRERILRALARADTGDSQVFDKLEYLPTRFFPRRSQLVLISPLHPDDLKFLIRLRAQGYEILVISPNPVMYEQKVLSDSPSVRMALRIATVERTVMLRQLRQAGMRTVDWDVDEPIEQTLAASLAGQPVWSRKAGIIG